MTSSIAGPPARFSLRHLDRPHSAVRRTDGGWWPNSLVLETELPVAIAAAARAGFATRAVSYGLGTWATEPRRVMVDDARVRLNGHAVQPAATVTLLDASGLHRLEIVVVPPDAPDDVAGRVLTSAADDHAGAIAGDEVLAWAYRVSGHDL